MKGNFPTRMMAYVLGAELLLSPFIIQRLIDKERAKQKKLDSERRAE